jgi:hypothetical protein
VDPLPCCSWATEKSETAPKSSDALQVFVVLVDELVPFPVAGAVHSQAVLFGSSKHVALPVLWCSAHVLGDNSLHVEGQVLLFADESAQYSMPVSSEISSSKAGSTRTARVGCARLFSAIGRLPLVQASGWSLGGPLHRTDRRRAEAGLLICPLSHTPLERRYCDSRTSPPTSLECKQAEVCWAGPPEP